MHFLTLQSMSDVQTCCSQTLRTSLQRGKERCCCGESPGSKMTLSRRSLGRDTRRRSRGNVSILRKCRKCGRHVLLARASFGAGSVEISSSCLPYFLSSLPPSAHPHLRFATQHRLYLTVPASAAVRTACSAPGSRLSGYNSTWTSSAQNLCRAQLWLPLVAPAFMPLAAV